MSLNAAPQTVTAAEYERIFQLERTNVYPMVDDFEIRMGYRQHPSKLEAAARVLSCPLKAAPPNWQHGRVIYAMACRYFETVNPPEPVSLLDVGTAKGFSALCLEWAREEGRILGHVTSVDVMPPDARVRRNTPAEVGGLRTLAEILEPWPEAKAIHFEQSTGINWLLHHPGRVHVAFVDGKHDGSVVRHEGDLLAQRQQPGDVVMFDDIQIPGIAKAVKELKAYYHVEYLDLKPERKYAIGVRR